MNVVQFIVDLEKQLIAAKDCGKKLIATDGVFSMDGFVAPLPWVSHRVHLGDLKIKVIKSYMINVLTI